ncbi:MAG: class I SAM-dependent methyltransferase [Wenzhouxiangella sp.]|nr:class I SAM-dependent methyltransferase [Wenzhouxiangella sp.]
MQTELESCSRLREHYNRLALLHGYSPQAVSFRCWKTIERRFGVLLEGFESYQGARILDFGCGVGHLYGYLKRQGFKGEYLGLDVSDQMIEVARAEYPDGRFECRNILAEEFTEEFDLAFVSGVFNNLVSDNESFIRSCTRRLFSSVEQGIAFNALSHFVHYRDEGLYYYDPIKVFEFCKTELTPRVALRHDYEIKPGVIPFEFTMYLYKTGHAPVPALQ